MEEREFGIWRVDTSTEKEWWGTMDNSGVVVLIEGLGDAKIANKSAMYTHSHSDFVHNIQ